MSSIGRDALTRRAGFKRAAVAVPEWGGDVQIRELSAGEILHIAHIQAHGGDAATSALLAHMLICGWIDDNGVNVFTPDDAEAILAMPSGIVTRIANEISQLSGAGPLTGGNAADAVADAKNA